MTIKIDPELKALIPPLATDEYKQLEANIIAEGCRDPLVVWDGILIDGHNRHEICTRHGIKFDTVEKQFDSRDEVIVWMILNQFGRRNLPAYIRAKLALRLEPIISAKAKENQVAGGGDQKSGCQKSDNPITPIDTKKEIAKAANVSHDTIAKVKKIEVSATPEVKAKLESGEFSINQAYQQIRQQQKHATRLEREVTRELKASEIAASMPSDVMDIRHCTMQEFIKSGVKFDCVISDPPYPKEFVHLYGELAKLCAEAGVERVAVMAGQSYLPDIITQMSKHLQYRWMMAYITPGGQAVQQWQCKVNTFWKPIILFGRSDDWIGDVAESKPNHNDKRFHHWGQSESGMYDLVKRLAKPGEIICDPFIGGGTTGVAALANGCKIIGCDIEKNHVEKSKERIEAQWRSMQ